MTEELEPMAVGPGPGPAPDPGPPAPRDDGDLALLRLIDRLSALLDRSDLTELEVEAGGTGLILRKPAALAPIAVATVAGAGGQPGVSEAGGPDAPVQDPGTATRDSATSKPSIKAPLTGIFYASPAPGSAPYVAVGGEVAVGQVIGLIEAMKLFNEIKSDLAGRVVRVVPESGTLVKAKQPLIEVEPL
ncbi:MAG: acetyl-CoA carboxylase biotin carboxyl carrier protein [Candidatus Limnocylindrales bacterium]